MNRPRHQTHPAYPSAGQLAALLRHATQHVVCEPQERFTDEDVGGNARALYDALGCRLGEPGHIPGCPWADPEAVATVPAEEAG